MKLVQFVIPEKGRRLGSLEQDIIIDITSQNNKISSVYEAFIESKKINSSIDDYLNNSINKNCHKSFVWCIVAKMGEKKFFFSI